MKVFDKEISLSRHSIAVSGIYLVTAIAVASILSSFISNLLAPLEYHSGDVARYSIRAPRDFLVEDTVSTEERRSQASAGVNRVFRLDDNTEEDVATKIETIFSTLSDLSAEEDVSLPSEISETSRKSFERLANVDIEGEEWPILLSSENWSGLADSVRKIVSPLLSKGVIASELPLERALENGNAKLVSVYSATERSIEDADDIFSMAQARQMVSSTMPAEASRRGKAYASLVRKLSFSVLEPNISFDANETERQILEARAEVEPTYHQIRGGEVIVRQGDIVSAAAERRLAQMRESLGSNNSLQTLFGYFLLSLLILGSAHAFVFQVLATNKRDYRDVLISCLALICSLLLLKGFSFITTSLGYADTDTLILATPLAAGGILLQVTVGATGVLLFGLSFALLTGLFLANSWLLITLIVLGNIIGAVSMRQYSRRSSFILAGLKVAICNMLVVLCFLLLFPDFSAAESATKILWALAGGITSGIIGGGLAPIVEYLGGYITDIKLLELASLDRPLLRELSVQAPGTWNHSMVIGQMGEAAADKIGANGLLVRVGAYYHDIGKMKKPAYFVENQTGENRHDKLSPSMSALIIKAHVKDGLEMAAEHRLPIPIVDFISQHHGTSLISYFYTKALKDADPKVTVDENHYRYGGPKPQSKEAGILMLADAIEASSRTLSDPTPAKLQGLVQKIINRIFSSGELDECDLTLQNPACDSQDIHPSAHRNLPSPCAVLRTS